MRDTRYSVLIEWPEQSKTYTPEFQTEKKFEKQWHSVLKRAYAGVPTRCLCNGSGDKKLAIRHHSNSNKFFLARWPLSGSHHSNDCIYYAPDANSSGLASYSQDVVQELASGELKVKLRFGLRAHEPIGSYSATPDITSDPKIRQSQPSMSLLALLHLLWSESDFHTWTPRMEGKRNMGVIHHHLRHTAKRIVVGRHRIDDSLLIGAKKDARRHVENNRSRVRSAVQNDMRLVIIAPLAKHTEERENSTSFLGISNFHGIPRIRIETSAWNMAKLRHSRAVNAWRTGHRVIAIVQADAPSGMDHPINMLSIGLMAVSEQWIPFDSQLEYLVEKKLRGAGREFNKPLRFDSKEEHVFPDFWLTDTQNGDAVPMEVFGMNTPEYQKRREVKTKYYNEVYGPDGWWYWDAASDPSPESIPQFPM